MPRRAGEFREESFTSLPDVKQVQSVQGSQEPHFALYLNTGHEKEETAF